MNKSKLLLEIIDCFYEDDQENVPDITSDDTIIHTVTDPQLQCPTCGDQIQSGIMHRERVQCPGCGHMVFDIGQAPLSGLRTRRIGLDQ